MRRLPKFSLVSFRDLIATVGPAVVLVCVGLWLAYIYIQPMPPKRIVMSTGVENGAYAEFAKQYKEYLGRYGIEIEFRTSQGSLENLRRLRDPASDVDIAFLQSGSAIADGDSEADVSEEPELVSLGSLFFEPVWIFYRTATPVNQLADLQKLRVNAGPRGSGTRRLMRQLLAANRIDPAAIELGDLESTPAVMGLLDGSIDAIVFVSAPESLFVQMLLMTPGIRLFHFDQAEAYSRRLSYLSPVTLPRGIVSLEQDLPPQDVHLVAPTATLVARESTHPAILNLFVQAASKIHGRSGWFNKANQFPTAEYTEIPVADGAKRFYQNGPPFLQRYLPFWAANLIERMWVVLFSLIALLLPLSRIIPPLYEWRVRSRVYRWYGQLREIEHVLESQIREQSDAAATSQQAQPQTDTLNEQLRRLEAIELRLNRISVPLSYADELYALRMHIDLVRQRIRHRTESLTAG